MPARSLFLLSLLVGLAACDRQPTAPVGLDTPAFDWTNNPDNGNVRIMRFEDGFIACAGAPDAWMNEGTEAVIGFGPFVV